MTFDPTKTPGAFGGAPAGAPHETTDGTVPTDVKFVSADGQVVSAVAMARANERDLPVYAPKPMSDEQAAAYLGLTVEQVQAKRAAAGAAPHTPTHAVMQSMAAQIDSPATLIAPAPTIVLTDAVPAAPAIPRRRIANAPAVASPTILSTPVPVPAAPDAAASTLPTSVAADPLAPLDVDAQTGHPAPSSLAAAVEAIHPRSAARPAVDEPYYPARSDSDSPSRGVPSTSLDQGKQITGGFGDVGEAQYFPMTGLELRDLVIKMLDAQKHRVMNDLRFSIALAYPRVRVRDVIEVECYASDGSFMIEKIMVPPHEKTPLDIARRHGDRCCFCVIEERIEMDDDGNSVTPPNAMRQEIGAPIPRKHAVSLPGGVGRLLVDVDS